MKHVATRSLIAMALVGTMAVGAPALAGAGSAAANSHHSSTTSTTSKAWHVKWLAYVKELKAANVTFRASLKSAHSIFAAAMAAATTATQRQAARTALQAAIAAALSVRANAITALGNPPAPPSSLNGTTFAVGVKAANAAFKTAMTAARTAYTQALKNATSATQRLTAHATFKTAIEAAIMARATAIEAIGTPSVHSSTPSA